RIEGTPFRRPREQGSVNGILIHCQVRRPPAGRRSLRVHAAPSCPWRPLRAPGHARNRSLRPRRAALPPRARRPRELRGALPRVRVGTGTARVGNRLDVTSRQPRAFPSCTSAHGRSCMSILWIILIIVVVLALF